MLTSMDCDGTKDGYDLELTRAVTLAVNVPVIASGGAGTLEHLVEVIRCRTPTPSWPPPSSTTASSPSGRPRSTWRRGASPSGCRRPCREAASAGVRRAFLRTALGHLPALALAYYFSNFFRSANAVIAGDLVRELSLTAAQLGLMSSLFYVVFALVQLPLGVRWTAGDRAG